ncbi:MAG: hypothetical protein NTY98_04525 [Verrucomicrobia bacterium]|nr:hypothetical protein [Verrucomicrobiota bacterium]
MIKIRIFVSSPGDVTMERVCAERIIERLRVEFSGRVLLDDFFWEHEPMRATASFNDPDNIPLTAEFDVVVCILWSRLGTMLSRKFLRKNGEPFPSGTAFEIETAIESYLERHVPDILVYRRTQEVPMPVNNPEEAAKRGKQLEALNNFIREWFFDGDSAFKAAINEYKALGQFEAKLEKPLRKLILGYLEKSAGTDVPATGAPPATYHGENPFRGLEAYDFEDAKIFFGRSQAIEDVLTAMRKQASAGRAFTLVHGASGSGKSSLLRAGVIPMMLHKSSVIEGVACWGVATLTPGSTGDDLLTALAASLQNAQFMTGLRRATGDATAFAQQLLLNPQGSVPAVSAALQLTAQEVQAQEALPALPMTKLVLLIDQFEQIFSDDRRFPPEQRKAFATALSVLARSGVVWVVATMRSDQLGRLTEDLPNLAELAQGGQYSLLAPTEMDMDLMIRLPARAAGVVFEEDPVTGERLETRLLREAREAPDGLPLLSFVLRELYAKRQRIRGVETMTHACLNEMGGLEGAVKTRAQEIFTTFVGEHGDLHDPLKQLARALVTVGNDHKGPALRRSAPLSMFTGSRATLGKLVDALVEGRLLTRTVGAQDQGVVFVTHEALLRKWSALAKAIDDNRSFLIQRARAATAATEWLERKNARDFLWDRGARLQEARKLLTELEDLDALEQQFVRDSVVSGARRKATTLILTTAAVLAISGTVYWNNNRQSAEDIAAEALRRRSATLEDLNKQLDVAVSALNKSVWRYDDYDDDSSEGGFGRSNDKTFPALDVIEISRRLLQLDPQNPKAYAANALAVIHNKASLLSAEDRQKQITQIFSEWSNRGLPKIELLDLEAQVQWKKGNKDSAIASWTSYLRTPNLPEQTRRRLLQRVSAYYLKQKKWVELESLVSNSWSWEKNAVASIRRAYARMKLMKLDLARQDYEAAKAAAPDMREVEDLGPELERLLSHQDAIEKASQKVAESSAASQPEPWLERARVLMIAQLYEQALPDFERAGKIMKGRSTTIDFLRSFCLQIAGIKPPENSKYISINVSSSNLEKVLNTKWPDLMELLALDKKLLAEPNNVRNLVTRSSYCYFYAQSHYGLADAEAAIKINPRDYGSHYWRGRHLIQLDRYQDALEVAQTLFQIEPRYYNFTEIKAEAEFGLNNFQAAYDSISAGLKIEPSSYYYELRAKYLRKLNRTQEAELDDQAAARLKRTK